MGKMWISKYLSVCIFIALSHHATCQSETKPSAAQPISVAFEDNRPLAPVPVVDVSATQPITEEFIDNRPIAPDPDIDVSATQPIKGEFIDNRPLAPVPIVDVSATQPFREELIDNRPIAPVPVVDVSATQPIRRKFIDNRPLAPVPATQPIRGEFIDNRPIAPVSVDDVSATQPIRGEFIDNRPLAPALVVDEAPEDAVAPVEEQERFGTPKPAPVIRTSPVVTLEAEGPNPPAPPPIRVTSPDDIESPKPQRVRFDTTEAATGRCQCNFNHLMHYAAKGCEPVFEGDACCPSRYNCLTEAERGLKPDRCYYNGKEYMPRDRILAVENLNECSSGCFCDMSLGLAQIVCASVECPSLFMPSPPGCRPFYKLGEKGEQPCCESKLLCERETPGFELDSFIRRGPESETQECKWDNQVYALGSKMYFPDLPCTTCVCSANFTGPNGVGCKKTGCGLDFRYRTALSKGCTPIYSDCCFYDWICPGDERINTQAAFPVEQVRSDKCTLGKIGVSRGQFLPLFLDALGSNIFMCKCQIPPDLVCAYVRN